jgi:hypothetical protein
LLEVRCWEPGAKLGPGANEAQKPSGCCSAEKQAKTLIKKLSLSGFGGTKARDSAGFGMNPTPPVLLHHSKTVC